MRTTLAVVLLVLGGVGLWLLLGTSPESLPQLDDDRGDPVADSRDAVLPVRPASRVREPERRPGPSPVRTGRLRKRDREGTGSASATVRVLDGSGKPVAGAKVFARLRKHPGVARPPGPIAHTAESGHATLRGLTQSEIEALLVFPPPEREDLARHIVPTWTGADTVVTLPAGYTLACVVRDHDGRPIPRASVGITDPIRGHLGQQADADGRYRFVQLPAGWYEVSAHVGTKTSGRVRAQAGGPEVVLEIDNRGRATIRIEGWTQGAFATRGRLTPDPLEGPDHVYLDVGTSDGTIVVRGANPDAVYALWLGTRDGKEVVYETDLRIDGRELVVRPQPALNVSGRLIVPPGSKVTAINVHQAGVFLKGTWVGTETYEVRGLPAGTWFVSARGKCPEGRLYGYVQVRAGDTADLELKRR